MSCERKLFIDKLWYHLIARAGKADDMMLSNSEIKSLALSVEGELFKCFKETNAKYKAKYRSLIFNLKDSKNQVGTWDDQYTKRASVGYG